MTDQTQMPLNLDKTPAEHSPFGPKPESSGADVIDFGKPVAAFPSRLPDKLSEMIQHPNHLYPPVVLLLLDLPADIKKKQEAFDSADTVYQGVLATVTLKAYSETLFPGKKDGEPKRAASNDDERKAAVAILTTGDSTLAKHAEERERALRELQEAKNKFEGAKLAAALLAGGER